MTGEMSMERELEVPIESMVARDCAVLGMVIQSTEFVFCFKY